VRACVRACVRAYVLVWARSCKHRLHGPKKLNCWRMQRGVSCQMRSMYTCIYIGKREEAGVSAGRGSYAYTYREIEGGLGGGGRETER
jgi:hypothetical protein